MTTFRTRHNKTNPYVMLNKGFLEDPNLSAKAKGILAYLLSRPDDWQTHTEHLIKVMRDGRDSILSGLKELEQAGYFIRYPVRDEKTQQITHWVKDVFESPQLDDGKAIRGKAVNGKAVEGNPSDGMPDDGNPSDGKPCEEMAVSLISNEVLSTDRLNTDLLTTDLLTPPTHPKKEVCVEKEELARNGGKPPAPNINNSVVSTAVIERIEQSTVICEDKSSGATASQIVEYNPIDTVITTDRNEQFLNGRKLHPQKNTYMSKSSDPWMEGGNPIPVFKMWVLSQVNRDPRKVTNLPNIAAELRNNYQRAQDWWDGFLADTQQRFETMERRLLSGGLPNEGELEELASVAPYADPVLAKSVIELTQNPQLSSRSTPSISAAPAPVLPQGAENPDCYKEHKVDESVADISPEEAAANIKKLREMIQSMGGKRAMPKAEKLKPKSVVEDLMADLEDPGIRFSVDVQARAQRFVGSDEEWCADYNDQGMITAIYRF